MAITEKSSLDELIAQADGNDPVKEKLTSAREQVQEAQEKLGIRESHEANGARPPREH